MMLRYSLGQAYAASLIEKAVARVLDAPEVGGFDYRTKDLGGERTTTEVGDKVVEVLQSLLKE